MIESPLFDAGVPVVEKVGICDQCKKEMPIVNGAIRYVINAAGFMICRDCAATNPPKYIYSFDLVFPKESGHVGQA